MKCFKIIAVFLAISFFSTSFNLSFSADYYWVGGTGNWADINHWATTSGNTANQLHDQVPGSNDNVYFDNNSFTDNNQTVSLNTQNAYCKDMMWTGTYKPTFKATNRAYVLNIYDSLELKSGMTYAIGKTSFLSANTSPGETIKTNGVFFGQTASSLLGHATFSGGGRWELLDDFIIGKSGSQTAGTTLLTLSKGELITNGYSIETGRISSTKDSLRTFDFRNSTIIIRSGATSTIGFAITGNNKTILADGSTIRFNGPRSNGSYSAFIIDGDAYHNLVFAGSSSSIDGSNCETHLDNSYRNQCKSF